MSLQLSAPQPLVATHLVDEFSSGEASLDEWLKRRALANQTTGASRTFVVTDQEGRVFGFYAMAAGAVSHQIATNSLRRNMPDPIPVMVLARLAVDHRAQGMQLGAALLQDAVKRAVAVSQNAGVRALLVHALNDSAQQFYAHFGFQESPQHPMTLMLRLNTVSSHKTPGTTSQTWPRPPSPPCPA
jgi:predicted N-acetyltransferase YhbS